MEPYIHKVHYYETDKMGIVHHSNYIRWMEEARVDFLEKIGIGFPMMEERGIFSPVTGVECRYRRPTRFDEQIQVAVRVESFNGIRLRITYEMHNQEDTLVATGASEHCFTDASGRPMSLKKTHPDVDAVLTARISEEKNVDTSAKVC